MSTLFDPITLGAIEAPNRMLMAPAHALSFNDGTSCQRRIMGEYYAQRAGAGLIISEATGISQQGLGTPFAPGIWNDAANRSVEARLWNASPCSRWPDHLPTLAHGPDRTSRFSGCGEKPVSSSATTAPGSACVPIRANVTMLRPVHWNLMKFRALLDDYTNAAENAKKAGFDGVQLHSANGYLIDQFIRSGTNFRDRRIWWFDRKPHSLTW